MTSKGCKNNGMKCLNCGKIHRDMTKNNNPGAIFWSNINFSRKHRHEMSLKLKGKPHSEEHNCKVREKLKGKCPKNIDMLTKFRFPKGDKHPDWNRGSSFEPYSINFNKRFKETIKERDHYACLLCNIFDDDAKRLYRKRLFIHHIDYDKKNSFPQNCASLCIKCHGLTNYNREHWKTFFQSLLNERYGYEYTIDQKIVINLS